MPSVNIRQLRETKKIKAWLDAGQTVELRERENVIARIVPVRTAAPPEHWPDFEKRVRAVIGDRTLSGADLLINDRSRY